MVKKGIRRNQMVIGLYEQKKVIYGKDTYRHVSEILKEAKQSRAEEFKGKDIEQAWKPAKGNALEALLLYIIQEEVESMGLKIVRGNKIDRTKPKNLPIELQQVKKNLAVDFGQYGMHIPDVDIVIYRPTDCRVVAVISSKVTLRERIAQTAYWHYKIRDYALTNHIKVYFMTPDEDGNFTPEKYGNKSRAIAEKDTDGSYVLTKHP